MIKKFILRKPKPMRPQVRTLDSVALRKGERLPVVMLHDDGTYTGMYVEYDGYVDTFAVFIDNEKKIPLVAVVNGKLALPLMVSVTALEDVIREEIRTELMAQFDGSSWRIDTDGLVGNADLVKADGIVNIKNLSQAVAAAVAEHIHQA